MTLACIDVDAGGGKGFFTSYTNSSMASPSRSRAELPRHHSLGFLLAPLTRQAVQFLEQALERGAINK